jgi:hypothetical protein
MMIDEAVPDCCDQPADPDLVERAGSGAAHE